VTGAGTCGNLTQTMAAIRTQLPVRPIAAHDRDGLAVAFERLSDDSRYQRFLHPKPTLSEAELVAFTDVDHRTHEALVALDPRDGSIVGVARYAAACGDCAEAELAVTVIDAWQGRGVGTMLARMLVPIAHANGIARLIALTFAENGAARALLRGLGFRRTWSQQGVLELRLELAPAAAAA
jgi:RimJ/RimL family protein N-acetyltransferase